MPNLPASPNQISTETKLELLRRRADMGASSAGMGAPAANSPASQNSIPTDQQTNPTLPAGSPAPSGGAAGSPSDGTVSAMKTQKGEASKLTDAMIFRMKKLTERGE